MKNKFLVALVLSAGTASGQQVNDPKSNIPQTSTQATATVAYPALINYTDATKRNFVRSYIPQEPIQNGALLDINQPILSIKTLVQTQYIDGLGRPLQEVVRTTDASISKDMVVTHIYDALGRESTQFLPFSYTPDILTTPMGKLNATPLTSLQTFYNALYPGQQPYSKTEFDNSPLNRPAASYGAGQAWVGSNRAKRIIYRTNTAAEDVRLWTIGFTATGLPVSTNGYADGELLVTETSDEDDHQNIEYKDKAGRVILVKNAAYDNHSTAHGGYACTYFVYDDFGHLRYVIPPLAVEAVASSWDLSGQTSLCYRYWYDDRGRQIERQIPGKEVEYLVYDRRDRLVLTQDGNLRASGKWAFTCYDVLDRPLFTGIYDGSPSTREDLTDILVISSAFQPTDLFYYLQQPSLFKQYPSSLTNGEVLTYTYYDDYTIAGPGASFSTAHNNLLTGVAPMAEQPLASQQTRGLVTGNRVKIMDGNGTNWLTNVLFYEQKGRLIQTQSTNHLGGNDITTNQYEFSGALACTVLDHTNPAATPTVLQQTRIVKRFTHNYYTGNIIKVEQNINGLQFRPIFANTFDGLNRVSNKLLGGAADNNYSYNIRGWLTGINADFLGTNPASRFFKERISYNSGFASKLYSGNIAGIEWQNSGDKAPVRFYGYSYDLLSRLTHAEFGERLPPATVWVKSQNDFTASEITYDVNGNLQTMNQMGPGTSGPILMDKLIYKYLGATNQLAAVDDGASTLQAVGTPDFRDGSSSSSDYAYDANGNLIQDGNKGISQIDYSYFNKPTEVYVTGKGQTSYLYDGLGNKLRRTVTDQLNSTTTVTDYVGPFVYENNSLLFVLHQEGRCRPMIPNSGTGPVNFAYDYFIKDHIGNVRSTIRTNAYSIGEWVDYNAQQYHTGLEVASASLEAMTWSHIGGYLRATKPGSGSATDVKAAELDGDDPYRRVATALMLRVMPGDRFELSAESYRPAGLTPTGSGTNSTGIMDALLSGLLDGVVGGENGSETGGANNALLNGTFSGNIASVWEGLTGEDEQDSLAPQSHLNYLVLDENLQVVASQSGAMQAGASGQWHNVGMNSPLEIGQAGYLLVFTSNKSSGATYWDNVNLTFYQGQMIDENHYYPFGLTLAREGVKPEEQNDYKLTTKGLQKDFGLNWYDFGARMMDEQTGRWNSLDIRSEKYVSSSPYAYTLNNTPRLIDPDGKEIRGIDAESRTRTLGWIADQLGAGLFEFKGGDGILQFVSKAAYKKAYKKFTPEQKRLADGLVEVMGSGKKFTVYALDRSENIHVVYNPSIREVHMYYDNQGVQQSEIIDHPAIDGKGIIFTSIGEEGAYEAERFYSGVPQDFDQRGQSRYTPTDAIILMNYNMAETETFNSKNGQTEPCASCLFFHSLLDHGLEFAKGGKAGPQEPWNVKYQNDGLHYKNSPLRDGSDHKGKASDEF